jgi:hypothetical protein
MRAAQQPEHALEGHPDAGRSVMITRISAMWPRGALVIVDYPYNAEYLLMG